MVQRYHNLTGASGVLAYDAGRDYIRVKFIDGQVYRYDHERPGRAKVARMKRLAESGRGLSTYISQVVRGEFAGKEH